MRNRIDKKYINLIKQWAEKIDFKMYNHDRGGVKITNLYKVFSDNRNYSTHIVFTASDIFIKEGTYNMKDFEKFGDDHAS